MLRTLCVLSLLLLTAAAHADTVALVAGGGDGGDGSSVANVKLETPFGVGSDSSGNVYCVEMTGHRVRKIGLDGIVTTVAGTGEPGYDGDGGPALKAKFNTMHSLAVAPDGTIYVADTLNNRVRKIDPTTQVVTTVAGTGQKGFSGDGGPATSAQFGAIYCIALAPNLSKLFVDDLDNRRIRVIDMKTGVVTTAAGNGKQGVPADGSDATAAPLVDPRAVAADALGNIYILEREGHALRVVDRFGKIRTVAGTGKPGPAVDGGDAISATLNGPKHLCIDLDNNVLIADTDNNVIRRYIPRTGKIVRVAGTGTKGDAGIGGTADQLQLNQPHGVYMHPKGIVYIVDSFNNRILKLEP